MVLPTPCFQSGLMNCSCVPGPGSLSASTYRGRPSGPIYKVTSTKPARMTSVETPLFSALDGIVLRRGHPVSCFSLATRGLAIRVALSRPNLPGASCESAPGLRPWHGSIGDRYKWISSGPVLSVKGSIRQVQDFALDPLTEFAHRDRFGLLVF